MRLTAKGRYAVMAMLDITLHEDKGVVTVAQLAERQQISVMYLERIAGKLRAAGLLRSIRGPLGGYQLLKPPQDITVAMILIAVEEQIDTTRCQGAANCQGGLTCITHHLWSALNHEMFEFLNNVTLESLAKQPHIQTIANRQFNQFEKAGASHESACAV